MKNNHWYSPIIHFAAHTFLGSVIFMVISIPAICLSMFIHWLEKFGNGFNITVLTYLEQAILLIDCVIFVAYLVIMAKRFIIELIKLGENHAK